MDNQNLSDTNWPPLYISCRLVTGTTASSIKWNRGLSKPIFIRALQYCYSCYRVIHVEWLLLSTICFSLLEYRKGGKKKQLVQKIKTRHPSAHLAQIVRFDRSSLYGSVREQAMGS